LLGDRKGGIERIKVEGKDEALARSVY